MSDHRYLSPGDPGTRMYFGRPGSGKTWAARADALRGASKRKTIVLDLNGEWIWRDGMSPQLRDWLRHKGRKVIVTGDSKRVSDMAPNTIVVVQASAAEMERAAERVLGNPNNSAIVITELHTYTPGRVAPDWLAEIATRWRHMNLAAHMDTQRIADVPRRVTELSTEIWLGNVTGPRDRMAVYGLAVDVDALASAHRRVCQRAAAGEKGVHVRLDEGFSPPYEVIGGMRAGR